jgi:TPR repeat protein
MSSLVGPSIQIFNGKMIEYAEAWNLIKNTAPTLFEIHVHETPNLKVKIAQVIALLVMGGFLAVYLLQKQIVEGVTTYPLLTLEIAANAGSPEAQFNLANAYYRGDVVNQDYNAAKKWYLVAAEQGLPMAQWALSIYYSPTAGIQKNETVAEDWRRKALRSDDEVIRKNLCTVYYHDKDTGEVTLLSPKLYSSIWRGSSESPEFAKLRQLGEQSDGNNLEARFNLGNAYYHAAYDYTGNEKDYQKAIELWTSAASWGYPRNARVIMLANVLRPIPVVVAMNRYAV